MLCGETAERPTLRERAPFVVDDLCEATRATAPLGVLDDLEVAYIERRPGYRPVSTFSTAARLPVHATALGKALLAFAPSQVVRMVLTPSLPAYTPATLTTPEQLHRALQCVRLHGMATSCGELQAGPVRGGRAGAGPVRHGDRRGGGRGGGPGAGDAGPGGAGAGAGGPRAGPGAGRRPARARDRGGGPPGSRAAG